MRLAIVLRNTSVWTALLVVAGLLACGDAGTPQQQAQQSGKTEQEKPPTPPPAPDAKPTPPPTPEPPAGGGGAVARGQEQYQLYCASCHGIDGRGGGPEARKRGLEPPDLTRLHQRYGSPLPRDRIAAFIDGREEVKAHGPREMPVWGERFFEGDPGPPRGVETAKRRTLDLLIDHLQSLQGHSEARLGGGSAQ